MQEQNEQELIREAMRLIGSKKTERKAESSRANISRVNEQKRAEGVSEETKEKLRKAQAERRERERQEREALGIAAELTEKKQRGRPRTKPVEDSPKRGRGRPKKQETTVQAISAEKGAQTQETAS